MRISVLGGGNIGSLMAAEFAAKGHDVRVRASDPQNWCDAIDVLDSAGRVLLSGGLELVTDELAESVDGAEVVWVTYPTFMLRGVAADLLPFVREGLLIGVVPGNDAEFFFGEHVRRGATLFGLQRVHSIARVGERGRSVYMLGRKSELQVAALPSGGSEEVARRVESLFDIPAIALASYLVETLTPSNPILHTTRLATMFRHWEPGVAYGRNILFYEEWDDASSELMLACDDELQRVCRKLESAVGVDLSQVVPLREHYESGSAGAMTKTISGIPAYRGLGSPMLESASGEWIPDFESRYFRADFAYGLKAIRDIARLAGVDVPNIEETYDWYIGVTGNRDVIGSIPGSLAELSELYG